MNAPFLQAGFVRAEIDKLLSAYPELSEDETLRLDMIEAETDALKVIGKALDERMEATAMVAGINSHIDALTVRRDRYDRKAEAMKLLIKSIMEVGHLPKLALPQATLSLTDPRVVVNIINADDIPQGYVRIKREPDKTAIKAALERGDEIPGAELGFGKDGLTIRTK